MNQTIGDKAAIAFAIGFYQALGAGLSIQQAYELGCVQIRLQGIPEHLTPVLIVGAKTSQNNRNCQRRLGRFFGAVAIIHCDMSKRE
jgi:hypothetical protein